jgi:hypothetical protein
MRMSAAEYNKLRATGKVKGPELVNPSKNTVRVPKPVPAGVLFIRQQLEQSKVEFKSEYYFAKPRMYRFDFAIPGKKVYIEYEGLVAPGQMGGHQTTAGYTDNTNKYNLAATLGWIGYRYTSRNYKNFEEDLRAIINK